MPVSIRRAGLALLLVAALIPALPSRGSGTVTMPAGGQEDIDPAWFSCRVEVARAELEKQIPAHLLSAISLVESGRQAPGRGEVSAWPWAVMAEGRGRYLPSKAAAIAEVERLRARGVRNIDVGCMQINLKYHPDAFASLDEAFDPRANVAYGAAFLTALRHDQGSWSKAVAYYHSATPSRHTAYRMKVFAAWRDERRRGLRGDYAAELARAEAVLAAARTPEAPPVPAVPVAGGGDHTLLSALAFGRAGPVIPGPAIPGSTMSGPES